MKRAIIGGVVAIVAIALGVFLFLQWNQKAIPAGQVAPANSVFYAEVPHLHETAKRWSKTAFYQMLAEPSVQRFLKRPLAKVPAKIQNAWAAVARLHPGALFFSTIDPDKQDWILGIESSAGHTSWLKEVGMIGTDIFGRQTKELPAAGNADSDDLVATKAGSWVLLGRHADTLRQAIENTKNAGGGIQSAQSFQECLANVPAERDLLCFLQNGPSFDLRQKVLGRLIQQRRTGEIRAVLATSVFEGARIRDTVFTYTENSEKSVPLERRALAITSPGTIGYLAARAGLSGLWRLSDQLADSWPIAETLRNYLDEARSFGIDPEDFDKLISTFEIVVDRDEQTDGLNILLLLRVTDPDLFQRVIDDVANQRFPDSCSKIDISGIPAYKMQLNARASIVFGVIGHELLVAGNANVFSEAVKRLHTGVVGLEKSDQYKQITGLVGQPDGLFVYVDTKNGFERFYNASRPMLAFGAALIPSLAEYVDGASLPETEEVSRHLSPIVLCRHWAKNGTIDESVGPVTAYEGSALLLGAALTMGLLR
jgi:hypothetical protein